MMKQEVVPLSAKATADLMRAAGRCFANAGVLYPLLAIGVVLSMSPKLQIHALLVCQDLWQKCVPVSVPV